MTTSKSNAYIEVTFDKETKDYFSKIVNQLVPKNNFYYSPDPEYSHINGDVTQKLHCTLFFGIDPSTIKDKKLLDIIDNSDFREITLGDLVILNGWQNEYKIICIEVLDEDGRFTKFVKEIEGFVNNENIAYEVKPHISLAYVQPDYELPKQPVEMNKKIKSHEVKVSVLPNS